MKRTTIPTCEEEPEILLSVQLTLVLLLSLHISVLAITIVRGCTALRVSIMSITIMTYCCVPYPWYWIDSTKKISHLQHSASGG